MKSLSFKKNDFGERYLRTYRQIITDMVMDTHNLETLYVENPKDAPKLEVRFCFPKELLFFFGSACSSLHFYESPSPAPPHLQLSVALTQGIMKAFGAL